VITRAEADKLYNESSHRPFVSMEDLFDHIRTLASHAAYETTLNFEDADGNIRTKDLREVWVELLGLGFDVSRWNGEDHIIEITWG
jgi:hypothetical protein